MVGRVAVAVTATLAMAAPAGASELQDIAVPSKLFDATEQAPGATPPGSEPREQIALRAKVLLPDGYKASKRYPVLYLLHGAALGYDHWAAPGRGEIETLAAGFEGIIVMPEGGAIGFYSDWWDEGARASAKWESYYLRELVPTIERRYRIRSGRRWHAIAGLSMGGYGTMYLASQLPGYFGSASSFSGALDDQDFELTGFLENGATLFGPGMDQAHLWGPPAGWYADAHNPVKLVENLRATRLFVSYGTGTPCNGDRDGSELDGVSPRAPAALNPPLGTAAYPALLGELERLVARSSKTFVAAADDAGIGLVLDPQPCGTHWWETWQRAFRLARQTTFFKPVVATVKDFTYSTSAQRGRAWNVRFAFAKPPTAALTLTRKGRTLAGAGEGRLKVRAPGCRFAAQLPFERRC